MPEDEELMRVLWFVLGGARGGLNRARMIQELSIRPMNLNQMAEKLGVDYRTIMHHAAVLKSNSLVTSEGDRYGAVYFLTPRLKACLDGFEEIVKTLKYDVSKSQKEE